MQTLKLREIKHLAQEKDTKPGLTCFPCLLAVLAVSNLSRYKRNCFLAKELRKARGKNKTV